MEKAGIALDSRVARHVFGFVVIIDTQAGQNYMMGLNREAIPVPPYSTDAETAEQIVELLKKHDFELSARNKKINGEYVWVASFTRGDGRAYVASYGDTLAAAICAAGIAAVDGTNSHMPIKK